MEMKEFEKMVNGLLGAHSLVIEHPDAPEETGIQSDYAAARYALLSAIKQVVEERDGLKLQVEGKERAWEALKGYADWAKKELAALRDENARLKEEKRWIPADLASPDALDDIVFKDENNVVYHGYWNHGFIACDDCVGNKQILNVTGWLPFPLNRPKES